MDAIYLDKLELISEDAALIAYEYTFFIYGIILFIYLKLFKKEKLKAKEYVAIFTVLFGIVILGISEVLA